MLWEHPPRSRTPKSELWCFFGVPSLRRLPAPVTFIHGRRDLHCESPDSADSSKAAASEAANLSMRDGWTPAPKEKSKMSAAQAPALNMDKLNAFIGQFVTDLGASVHAGMVVIGEKLGLYKALAAGPMTPAELAARTGTDERYLHEWLASQAAGGYVTYNEGSHTFSLTQEQAFTLACEDSPAYLPGAFELALGSLAAVPRIAESFRTGAGMGWHEH